MCQNIEKMILRTLRSTVLAVLSLIGVANAIALVVEPPGGGAILGSPIEFSLRAILAPGEDVKTLCVHADVLQADVLVSPSRIRVQVLSGSVPSEATIRISSAVVVEEPVLSVIVGSGCVQKNIRKFVVFADPPVGNLRQPSVPVIPLSLSRVPPAELQTEPRKLIGRLEVSAGSDGSATAALPSRLAQKQGQKNSKRPTVETDRSLEKTFPRLKRNFVQSQRLGAEKISNLPTSRLKLEALEGSSDPAARLKSSFELSKLPLENFPQRAEFQALWRVLGSSPDDLKQDLQNLKVLKAESLELKKAAMQNRVDSERVVGNLKTAEEQQYKNPLVYGLATLVGLLILALFSFHSFKNKSSPTWWSAGRDRSDTEPLVKQQISKEGVVAQLPLRRESGARDAVQTLARRLDRKQSEAIVATSSLRSEKSAFGPLAYQASTRDVNVEELFDIQQQADFFISLGQHDQAIEVLNNHIKETAQASPLVYLDLMSLYHAQDRVGDYDELATKFTRLFNGMVPVFDAFEEKTLGLEAYPALLGRIESLWCTTDVINVIENSLFRSDSISKETLSLEAYRELVLLHSVAKDIVDSSMTKVNLDLKNRGTGETSTISASLPKMDSSQSIAVGFKPTVSEELQPQLPNFDDKELSLSENRTSLFQKPVGARIGLDIDLSN